MLVPHGKPYAGKLHVRFDEGAGAPDEGRSALLYLPCEDCGGLGVWVLGEEFEWKK